MTGVLLPMLAVVAGVLSFSSPCCLPLLPGYMSFISGLPDDDPTRAGFERVAVRASLLFVAGFTVVFTALGATATILGAALLQHLPTLVRLSGVAIIIVGIAMATQVHLPLLQREFRFPLHRVARGPRGAFVLGVAFAFGWAPCIGPILASILTLAAASPTVAWGMTLLALYSLGLGLPFVALALGVHRARRATRWLRRHGRAVEISGGLVLVGVGVLFVTGMWDRFFVPLQAWFADFGWPPL